MSRLRAVLSITITMKPHLPACLFQALLATCAAALTTSAPVFADVPEGYEPVTITDVNQLADYTSSDYIAFIISSDITNNEYRMTGVHQYWGDDVLHMRLLTFAEIKSASPGGALFIGSELVAERLQGLLFSQNVSTAVNGGGVIYASSSSNLIFTGNGTVTFSENNATTKASSSSYSYGGAIYGGSSSVITLSGNGNVTYSGNYVSTLSTRPHSYGGAIYIESSSVITLNGNGNVTFGGNYAAPPLTSSAPSYYSSYSCGGAIFGGSCSIITLSDNESVTFSGNYAATRGSNSISSGGAIYGESGSSITLSGNGNVVFDGNYANATGTSSGGAIWGNTSLMDNESVMFSDNRASSSSFASGGAICGSATLMNNGSVEFSKNRSTSSRGRGGAISAGGTRVVMLSDNKSVTFSDNWASSDGTDDGGGGAIYIEGELCITSNGSVAFSGNYAREHGYSGFGGAIFAKGTNSIASNVSVMFSGNYVAGQFSATMGGGAICTDGTFNISSNKSVTFNKNYASKSGRLACGGAIFVEGALDITNNESVAFTGNYASADYDIYGGAIYGSDITLLGNGVVAFNGNYTTAGTGFDSYGGAIYSTQTVNVMGNEGVVFQGNYEQANNWNHNSPTTYRLRSLYMDGGSLNLSAGKGQNITFYDTLYASSSTTVSLNAQYQDKDGVMQDASGDIVFSGAHAEEDLVKLKPNYTQQELMDSLTTEVNTTTNLYGGRLRIEDGAIFKGNAISLVANSNATLRLANGELNNCFVSLAADTTLDLQGVNKITGCFVDMQEGSILSFTLGEVNLWNAALMNDCGIYQEGDLTINIQSDESYDSEGKYMLISWCEPTLCDPTKITLTGIDTNVNHLTWEAGTLYYCATPPLVTACWTGEKSREWNFSDKNWEQGEVLYCYMDGVNVVFDDTGSGEVVLPDEVKPLSVLVENSEGHDYSFIGEGSLAGATALTKRGEGKLTIATANTYTGGAVVEGGTLVVGNSAALGTGGVEMSAGVLDLGGNTIANNVTTQGEVCITNGGIAGNVSMSNTVLEIARDVTIDGTITASSENLIAVDADATLSISQTIANTGSYLEIAGAVDVSNIVGTKVGESSYIGGAVQGNGFEQSNMRIQVISDSKTSRHDISEAVFIYKGTEVKLDSTCAFNVGETDYTVFFVNSGTESLDTALDGAEAAQVELAGVVMESGTELTVDRNASTDLIQVKSGKATMNIAEGVTLSETNATRTDFILQGAGQYQLASGSTTLGATLGENWKGAVQLVDVDVFEDFDLNKYGKAGSVVQMDGASVKLAPSNNVPFLPTLELTGDGMTITECYASETYIFAGGVVGDGDFVYNPTGLQHKQTYIFTGDVSQWTGAYESAADKTSTLKFDGNAVEMGAAIKATAGTVNVEVGNGTDAFAAIFGNDISASSLKVLVKAAATLTKDTTIAGGIEVAGSLKIQGEGQLNVGDSVSMGAVDEGTPATLAGVDISSSKLSARGEDKAELSGLSITTKEDFKLENVRLDGSFIDIGEDTTFYIKDVEITADTRITDGAAHMFIEGGKAFLDESNTEASAPTMSLADVTFYRSGDTETWMTLRENVSLVSLTSELFTKVMLTGTDLWLDLTDLSAQVGNATAFSISFEDGALFDVDNLRVYATLNGVDYLDGYTTLQSGGVTTLYFSKQIPEPTTSTLSLLALAALATRRRRVR